MISGNNKPGLRSIDEAIKARVKLLPFSVFILVGERDLELKNKLKAEWPGILQWMIDGCLHWQRVGMKPQQVVVEATDSYLADEDTVSVWLDDVFVQDKKQWTSISDLFESWRRWADEHGEFVIPSRRLMQRLEALGYVRDKGGMNDDIRGFKGLESKGIRAHREAKEKAAAKPGRPPKKQPMPRELFLKRLKPTYQ
jgi:putative DNA primase/helicase